MFNKVLLSFYENTKDCIDDKRLIDLEKNLLLIKTLLNNSIIESSSPSKSGTIKQIVGYIGNLIKVSI